MHLKSNFANADDLLQAMKYMFSFYEYSFCNNLHFMALTTIKHTLHVNK